MAKPESTNIPFIGTETLTQLARSIAPEVAISAYVDREAVFNKFHIKVYQGIDFEHVGYIIERKAHTSRRKVLGTTLKNVIGYTSERKLTTYLAWNRYFSNINAYREVAIRDANGNMGYPKSVDALRTALLNYSEDVYDNFWHGDAELGELNPDGTEKKGAELGLYDGIFTCIAKDINAQKIKPIELSGTIQRPVDNNDSQAYNLFVEFRDKWDNHLKNAPLVVVAMNDVTAMAIADAYGNSKGNLKEVIWLPNGNYRFPMWPNIEIAYDASIGVGDRMMAYTDKNLEYGVDTMNPENTIKVEVGGYGDADTVVLQPETAQGTRLFNPTPSHFAISNGSLAPVSMAGDYYVDSYSVTANDTTLGTVKVNGNAPDNTKNYDRGTILTITAEPTAKGEFVKWSNGLTDLEIKVTTKGNPEAITAIFKSKSATPAPSEP